MDIWTYYGLVVTLVGTSFAITLDYFPTKCNSKTSITTSHQLESSPGLSYSNNINCTFTVSAPSNRRILAKFPRFDLEGKLNGTCMDYVNLYDGDSTKASRLNSEPLCGTKTPSIYNSTSSAMTVSMVTDGTSTAQGFALTFTVIYEGSCGGNDFSCNNSFCISSDLECNGLDQCGDYSDEATCSTKDMLLRYGKDHAPMIAGIVLGIVVAGIVAVVLGMYVYKRNKWRRFLNDDTEDDSIWEIESAYPVTQRYFKGNRGRPNYNTLNEAGEAQPAMAENDILPRDIDISAEPSTNANV